MLMNWFAGDGKQYRQTESDSPDSPRGHLPCPPYAFPMMYRTPGFSCSFSVG
jgi:hypothetical protein